jgi:integrase
MTARRQANGRSSIYLGGDGRWYGRVSMGFKPDGSPDRRKRSGKTQAEVTRKVKELEAMRDAGVVTSPGRAPTAAEWFTHWLDNIVGVRVAPATLAGYESDIRLYAIPGLGRHRVDQITPEHIDALYASLSRRGKSPAVIQHVRRTIRAAFNDAVARDRIPRNPVLRASAPKITEPEIEPFTLTDARKILDSATRVRNGGAWTIAISLGLRRGEVLALKWADIDMEDGALTVRRKLQRLSWQHGCTDPRACNTDHHRASCPANCATHRRLTRGCPPPCSPDCVGHARHCPQRQGGGLQTGQPKSQAGRRPIALPAPLVELLRAHRKFQAGERLRAGAMWEDNDFVFCQENGRPLDPDGHSKAWKRFLAQAGVREGRLHDARHTAATLLLVQGVDQRTVMALMGWSEVSMTKRYQHVIPELRREAATRVGAALWGSSEPDEVRASL